MAQQQEIIRGTKTRLRQQTKWALTALIVKLCLHLPDFAAHRRHAMGQTPTAAVQLHAHLFYGFVQGKLAFQAACHTLLPCTSDLRPQHSR